MKIIPILDKIDLRHVSHLAELIWRDNYAAILSTQQMDYMMEMMYSPASLLQQWEKGICFYLVEFENEYVGYFAFEINYKGKPSMHLHKIYVLPTLQGKGLGKEIVAFLSSQAQAEKQSEITLNVNRFNQAKIFYEKVGFSVLREEDINIGKGYWMNDYVMRKSIP